MASSSVSSPFFYNNNECILFAYQNRVKEFDLNFREITRVFQHPIQAGPGYINGIRLSAGAVNRVRNHKFRLPDPGGVMEVKTGK